MTLVAPHGEIYLPRPPATDEVRPVGGPLKRTLDVAGHYGRPDIFKLEISREHLAPVEFS